MLRRLGFFGVTIEATSARSLIGGPRPCVGYAAPISSLPILASSTYDAGLRQALCGEKPMPSIA